jgi:hypothetical protein
MLPFGSPRSLPIVKVSGFFQAHFSAAVGVLNNTKSVGFTLEGDRTREIYRFLKRTVPIKRVDFLAEAQENGLINRQTAFRPCSRVSVHFAVKSVLASFSHGVSFSSKQAGQTEAGQIFWIFISMCIYLFMAQSPFRPGLMCSMNKDRTELS